MFLTTIPIWQRLAGGKISFFDWLFPLILKVPFFHVEDRSSIKQNLGKENPVSRLKGSSWGQQIYAKAKGSCCFADMFIPHSAIPVVDAANRRRKTGLGGSREKSGLLIKRKPPGRALGARKIRLCRWIRKDEISFRRSSSISVRFVSDPSRASQKFRPLYRPAPNKLDRIIFFAGGESERSFRSEEGLSGGGRGRFQTCPYAKLEV
jgi:hypothetical protein